MASGQVYTVELTPAAERDVKKLPRPVQRPVLDKIASLAQDPRPPDSVKLEDTEFFRVREGNYRIVYTIDGSRLVVAVVKVADRKDVYRRLR
jgi:mRNA interferase RelE/StbE